MHDHLTLYLHYRRHCPVTDAHLARLREIEGEDRVVPLDVSGRPGAIDLGPYAHEPRWHGPDAAVYRWARSPAFVPARRYFVLEWDVLVNSPLRDWIGDRYDAALAATSVGDPATHPDWEWWQDLPLLPGYVRARAACLCPYGAHLISGRCLEAVVEQRPVPGVFCELRLASYARAAGFEPTAFSPDAPGRCWLDPMAPSSRPGVWHPVKSMQQPCNRMQQTVARFTAITACSRPDNLPALAASLAALPNPHGYELHWWVVFDAPEAGPVPDVPGWTVHVLAHREPGNWGHAQANRAMDEIRDGFVWILDDDNLAHPGLLACRYEPGTVTLIGQQVSADSVRVPAPSAGNVDKAQIVADRAVVGDVRLPLDCFGDGRFVELLHAARPEATRIDPEVRAFYNRLQWPA